jgi:hypothetical protein
MPRKPKTTIEALPVLTAESAAPAPKKRAVPKKNEAAPRGKKTAPPTAASTEAPKRVAKPKVPKHSAAAAKLNGTSPLARAARPTVFDASSYHVDIARLAYYLWEKRGRAEGSPEEDWLRAEQAFRQTVLVESA